MPNSHTEPRKTKQQGTEQSKTEAQRPQTGKGSQTKPETAAGKGKDTHRELPEQRADWEGMAPQAPQSASGEPDSSDEQALGSDQDERDGELEGEGSYSGARQYNRDLKKSMAAGKTATDAKAAKQAVEGPEGEELRRAERAGKQGPSKASQ